MTRIGSEVISALNFYVSGRYPSFIQMAEHVQYIYKLIANKRKMPHGSHIWYPIPTMYYKLSECRFCNHRWR